MAIDNNMQYTVYPVPTNAILSLLAQLVDNKIVKLCETCNSEY